MLCGLPAAQVEQRHFKQDSEQATYVTKQQFCDAATACCSGVSDVVLSLRSREYVGVAAVTPGTAAALNDLFDEQFARNKGMFNKFTLADLSERLGLGGDEAAAYEFLARTAAVRRGQASKLQALGQEDDQFEKTQHIGLPAAIGEATSRFSALETERDARIAEGRGPMTPAGAAVAVPVSRDEFINFFAHLVEDMNTDEVAERIQAFRLLQKLEQAGALRSG